MVFDDHNHTVYSIPSSTHNKAYAHVQQNENENAAMSTTDGELARTLTLTQHHTHVPCARHKRKNGPAHSHSNVRTSKPTTPSQRVIGVSLVLPFAADQPELVEWSKSVQCRHPKQTHRIAYLGTARIQRKKYQPKVIKQLGNVKCFVCKC